MYPLRRSVRDSLWRLPVLEEPVFLAVLGAIADHQHGVIGLMVDACWVAVDPAPVPPNNNNIH